MKTESISFILVLADEQTAASIQAYKQYETKTTRVRTH